jgi:retron-type reverse transcriptase
MAKFSKRLKKSKLKKRFYKRFSETSVRGADGVTPEQFEKSLDEEIEIIQRKVENFSYRFTPFREKLILKGKDKPPRAVAIPTVRDRLVIDALHKYLSKVLKEPLQLSQIPLKESVAQVVETYQSGGYNHFLKFDIQNFFPSIRPDILLEKLRSRITDKQALSLISKYLNTAGKKKQGVAQGTAIAGLLANFYLHEIDQHFKSQTNLAYYRYVDDIIIFCDKDEAYAITQALRERMTALGLTLHDVATGEKTEAGNLANDRFCYLGYCFDRGRITVRAFSLNKLRLRLIELMRQRSQKQITREEFIRRLNIKITGCYYHGKPYGWLFYFQHIDDLSLLHQLEHFVQRKLKQFKLEKPQPKVKSFAKTYYHIHYTPLNKLDESSYLPSFSKERSELLDEAGDFDYKDFFM